MLDVLAFGAHPDDIEIFAGGSIARFAREGRRVGLVHLTRGEAGTRGTPELRASEAREAATRLGAPVMEIFDFGDGRIADTDANRERVVAVLRRMQPTLVLAPWPSDDHPDHSATGQIVKSAFYLSGIAKAWPEHPGAHRPVDLWFYPSHEMPTPSLVVPFLEEDLARKMAAIAAYRSQLDEEFLDAPRTRISDPSFTRAIEARTRFMGSLVNAEYGEAFHTTRPVSIRQLSSVLPTG